MKLYDITTTVRVYDMDELSSEDQQLVYAAKNATKSSYAPYSHFCVGAAVRLADGLVITGSNQENAAFPSGLCAERTAHHPDTPVVALAVAAFTQGHFLSEPIPPCGACRQVIMEVEDRYQQPIRIILYGTSGIHVVETVKALLPLYFVGAKMK